MTMEMLKPLKDQTMGFFWAHGLTNFAPTFSLFLKLKKVEKILWKKIGQLICFWINGLTNFFAHLQENVIKKFEKNYVKKIQPIMANKHHTHLQKKILKKF